MTRTDIINSLIAKHNYQSYLEIGVSGGENINRVNLSRDKITGVDPKLDSRGVTHFLTSDEFFAVNQKIFDIVFIDGLHLDYQVDRDIINSLKFLTTNGTIVLHDCSPKLEENASTEPRPDVLHWNGTTWMSIVKIRCNNPNISVSVVDTDFGCGIVQKGHQILYTESPLQNCLNWSYFESHRQKLLNLITVDEFKNIYLK